MNRSTSVIHNLISVTVIGALLTSCQTMPTAPAQYAEKGMNVMEVLWLEGFPLAIEEGYDETFLKYNGYVDVIRKGFFSHKITGSYSFSADAINAGGAKPQVYFIKLSDELTSDIYYQYYTTCLERALALAGIKTTKDQKNADAVMDFEFSVIEQKENKIQSELVPVGNYSWTNSGALSSGHSSTSFYSPNSSSPILNAYGNSSSSTSGYASTTSVTWQTMIHTVTEVSYNRKFVVNARSTDRKKPFWRLTVNSNGQTSDQRLNFAAVTAFSSNFFGKDSRGQFKYFTGISDPRIQYIQGDDSALNYLKGKPDLIHGLKFDFSNSELIRQTNQFGDTPAILAVKLHAVDAVDKILSAGASPDQYDKHGKPILAWAVDTRDPVLIEKLFKFGASPSLELLFESTSNNKVTVFDYAKRSKDKTIAALFDKYSKNPVKPKSAKN